MDNFGSRSFNSKTSSYPFRFSEPKKKSLTRNHSVHKQFVSVKLLPPPPQLPLARFWEIPSGQRPNVGPPVHPKLKPLHWDKVRTSFDRAMENRVLDPKKSQNIDILLKALNDTIDEVCEALLEGNADSLGTELLESLQKMAPTKEEERKLKKYKDESPFKLGPIIEKFLKVVLDIPFAFKRVEALLYIANFDYEVDYLKRSFETLEVAWAELRNSKMFMKLLETVLKIGNRMNVGTNRSDAHDFKLDNLLKLVDVKYTDGKTTLLHFVVQEIIRAEGLRLSGANAENTHQSSYSNDVEFRKLGLQKATAMDSDVLIREVVKLSGGMTKIAEVLKLNEEIAMGESGQKFLELMKEFIKKAEREMVKLQTQEKVALSQMKEITAYFDGSSAKEKAHPFRIFMVVRDFLSILDQVCKEVGKVNERSMVGFGRQFPMTTTSMGNNFSKKTWGNKISGKDASLGNVEVGHSPLHVLP
ncbi:hypothetical protein UlMin_028146 [Ulmus minor]